MKKRKLPPLQYSLRFPPTPDCLLPWQQRKRLDINLPVLVFQDGEWCLYKNSWKRKHGGWSVRAKTIPELQRKLAKMHNAYKFGGYHLRQAYILEQGRNLHERLARTYAQAAGSSSHADHW